MNELEGKAAKADMPTGQFNSRGAAGAALIVNQTMLYLYMAEEDGLRLIKTEVVLTVAGRSNYAYGLGVINTLIALGWIEEIQSDDMNWLRLTAKGYRYVRQ